MADANQEKRLHVKAAFVDDAAGDSLQDVTETLQLGAVAAPRLCGSLGSSTTSGR